MISALQIRIATFTEFITQMSELDRLQERVREAELAAREPRRYLDAPPITPGSAPAGLLSQSVAADDQHAGQ
jgi:hypothetical protein